LNGKEINLTGDNVVISSTNFNVDKDGNMSCNNANITGTITSSNATITGGKVNISTTRSQGDKVLTVQDNQGAKSYVGTVNAKIGYTNDDWGNGVYIQGTAAGQNAVYSDVFGNYSLATFKKNFEKLNREEALDIIKNTEIYKYNLKNEDDNSKKHIGFVIGENYNYSKQITTHNIDGAEIGADTYSMISAAYRVIQEQQKQIEKLQQEINNMKGEKNNG
jgi:hypothetical protein